MRQATESLEAAGVDRFTTGTVVGGRFRIESLLAREGGTAVYRATDSRSDSLWALRIVPLASVVDDQARLMAEMEKTQALRHKNLVEVEAVGRESDFLYMAAEFVDGQTLREFIDGKRADGRAVSLKGACNLVAHVANALDYAKRVTLHGALNPAIIWVNRAGRVKVAGLGLAAGVPTLARHGAPDGWPETIYVAPEVLAGGSPTPTSEVYSLGVILYELLTGTPPSEPYRPPSTVSAEVPVAVDAVVQRAVARDPDSRWPSVAALKEAVHAAAGFGGGDGARHSAGAPQPAAGMPGAAGGGQPGAQAAVPAPAGRGAGAAPRGPAPAPADAGPERAPTPIVSLPVGPEDGLEKWLVHKDHLDFGPFSMVQIRAQIERGDILADHMLIDNDSGSRCRIKEYPGLNNLAKSAHRRLEQARRAQAEQRTQKSEKKKSLMTTIVVTLVVAGVLIGVAFFVVSRRDTAGGKLASREEEAEIESFLKGVKIGGLKATVKRSVHRGGTATSGGAADEFNNDQNLGDVTKGESVGDQTLDDDQIQNTMMANYRKLIPCVAHAGVSEIAMEFVVRGNGKVSAVRVNGQRAGALPGCMLGRMQSFNFPKFNGSKTIASWSMSMH